MRLFLDFDDTDGDLCWSFADWMVELINAEEEKTKEETKVEIDYKFDVEKAKENAVALL